MIHPVLSPPSNGAGMAQRTVVERLTEDDASGEEASNLATACERRRLSVWALGDTPNGRHGGVIPSRLVASSSSSNVLDGRNGTGARGASASGPSPWRIDRIRALTPRLLRASRPARRPTFLGSTRRSPARCDTSPVIPPRAAQRRANRRGGVLACARDTSHAARSLLESHVAPHRTALLSGQRASRGRRRRGRWWSREG